MPRSLFCCDETGAVFAEFAILLPIIVTIVCGSVDFLYAFYQWNAAAKAVEVGARMPQFPIRLLAGSITSRTKRYSMARHPAPQFPPLPSLVPKPPVLARAPAAAWREIPTAPQPWTVLYSDAAVQPVAMQLRTTQPACAMSWHPFRPPMSLLCTSKPALAILVGPAVHSRP